MRFLRDAFQGRKECIHSFSDDLANFLLKQANPDSFVLSLKIALETTTLLNTDDIDQIVTAVIKLGNQITNEAAVNSCRNLNKISKKLEKA